MPVAGAKPLCFGLVGALAVAGGVGCAPRESGSTRARLVLLYMPCTVSRLHLGPYDVRVPYTPALSSFAREATVFLRHQTESAQSGLDYASILSGAQADRHGVFRHPSHLRDEAHLLAEAFAEHGYETHFWSGHPMAGVDLDYGQGVRPGNVHLRPLGQVDAESLTANDVEFAAILARLKRDRSYRAFVQVTFTLTHAPYTDVGSAALSEFRRAFPQEWPALSDDTIARDVRRYKRNRRRLQWDFPAIARKRRYSEEDIRSLALTLEAHYKAGIHKLDRLFGRLIGSIRAAGLLEDSLIAFTADHGETLYREHTLFKWTHGLQLSPDAIQVPLLIRLPGRRGVAVFEGVTRSIDVHPTLLGLAGLRGPRDERIDGIDLSAAVMGQGPVPVQRSLSHTMALTPELVEEFDGWLVSRFFPTTDVRLIWTAVRDGDTWLRRRRDEGGRWVTDAFDLALDPGAAHDIFDAAVPLHRELAREAESYQARLASVHARYAPQISRDESDARERLRALGYIQ